MTKNQNQNETIFETFEQAVQQLKQKLVAGDYYTTGNGVSYIVYDREWKHFEIRDSDGSGMPIDEVKQHRDFACIRILEINTGTLDEYIDSIIRDNPEPTVPVDEQRELIIDDLIENEIQCLQQEVDDIISDIDHAYIEEKNIRENNNW